MRGVPKLWTLVISCLEELGIEVELVSLPVLKIWEGNQLDLAEILIIDLASSLVEYGGLNPTAAGARNLDAVDVDMSKELQHVFYEQSWLRNNIEADISIEERKDTSLDAVTTTIEQLIDEANQIIKDFDFDSTAEDIRNMSAQANEIRKKVEKLIEYQLEADKR